MASRLVNVRLDDARLRKAQTLRARGVRLSDVVREAIDQRYAEETGPSAERDLGAIVQEIFAQFPDPADLPARTYDVHSRTEARAAVAQRVRRQRP